jgi:hypothetical protein
MLPVRSLVLSLAIVLCLVGVASAQSALPWTDNFNGSTPGEYIDSAGCDHVSYGGITDSGSLILLGGGLCWLGPFSAVPAGHAVSLAYTAISTGSSGAGSYRIAVVRASDNYAVALSATRDESFYATTGIHFYPGSQDVASFYIVVEHLSGVSFHFDNITVFSTDFAPAATSTPAVTSTPAATSTPVPGPTNTPEPVSTSTPVPTVAPTAVPTATPIPWADWILPQEDLFDPLKDLRETVTGKEPFYTIQRFYEQRNALQAAIGSPVRDDLSRYPSESQSFFLVLVDFLSPLLPYLQILFDAFVVVMFWQYITRRITT